MQYYRIRQPAARRRAALKCREISNESFKFRRHIGCQSTPRTAAAAAELTIARKISLAAPAAQYSILRQLFAAARILPAIPGNSLQICRGEPVSAPQAPAQAQGSATLACSTPSTGGKSASRHIRTLIMCAGIRQCTRCCCRSLPNALWRPRDRRALSAPPLARGNGPS